MERQCAQWMMINYASLDFFFLLKTAENNFGINSFWSLAQWIGVRINCFFLFAYLRVFTQLKHRFQWSKCIFHAVASEFGSKMLKIVKNEEQIPGVSNYQTQLFAFKVVIFNVCNYSRTRAFASNNSKSDLLQFEVPRICRTESRHFHFVICPVQLILFTINFYCQTKSNTKSNPFFFFIETTKQRKTKLSYIFSQFVKFETTKHKLLRLDKAQHSSTLHTIHICHKIGS